MEKMETEKSTYSVSVSVKCLSYDYISLIYTQLCNNRWICYYQMLLMWMDYYYGGYWHVGVLQIDLCGLLMQKLCSSDKDTIPGPP